jgi:hypothetical protein
VMRELGGYVYSRLVWIVVPMIDQSFNIFFLPCVPLDMVTSRQRHHISCHRIASPQTCRYIAKMATGFVRPKQASSLVYFAINNLVSIVCMLRRLFRAWCFCHSEVYADRIKMIQGTSWSHTV